MKRQIRYASRKGPYGFTVAMCDRTKKYPDCIINVMHKKTLNFTVKRGACYIPGDNVGVEFRTK